MTLTLSVGTTSLQVGDYIAINEQPAIVISITNSKMTCRIINEEPEGEIKAQFRVGSGK